MKIQIANRWRRATAVCLVVVGLALTRPLAAQTLDEAVARQLNADCALMGGENPTFFGADLNAICSMAFGSPRGTANSGGAGASSQTLAVSVENRRKAQLEEEAAAELADRWGLFVNANGETLDRDRTRFADGFDSTVTAALIGVDYRITRAWLLGVAYAYRNNGGDFDAGGDFDTTSNGGTLYMSIAPSTQTFFDISASYASKSHEVGRRAQFTEFDNGGNTNNFNGIVNSDTDGTELGAHAQFGYDFMAGRWTLGPRIGVNWTRTEIDGYAESGGGPGTVNVNGTRGAAGLALVYEDQEADSLQSILGFQGSRAATLSFGVLVTQANLDYIHEFDNEQRLVRVRFVQDGRPAPSIFQFQTEEPVEDFFKVGVSFVAVLKGGMQPFINLQAMVGNDQFENYAATLGVRFEL